MRLKVKSWTKPDKFMQNSSVAGVSLDILVLFPFEWVTYSTPVLNLVEVLRRRHKVTVLSTANREFRTEELPSPPHETLTIEDGEWKPFHARAALLTDYFNFLKLPHSRYPPYEVAKMFRMLAELERRRPDCVIAVDSLGLLLTTQVFDRVIYFSLELCRDEYFHLSRQDAIQCVITQTQERYRYFFGDRDIERFIIPNSDFFRGRRAKANRRRIIYFGNVTGTHGMSLLPEIARRLPEGYTLTLTGMVVGPQREWMLQNASDVIESGKLILENRYIPQEETHEYLSRFSTGLAFYDFESLRKRREMECTEYERPPMDDTLMELYTTTKIFNYFSAGVPVVGSDIPCMSPVREFESGILLDVATPDAVVLAIEEIDRDQDRFNSAAYDAAEHFEYARHAERFTEGYLESSRFERSRILPQCTGGSRGRFLMTMRRGLRARRETMRANVRARLNEIRRQTGGEPIVVYGAGRHTSWLMLHTQLSSLNLTCVADANPKYWGRRKWDLDIRNPDEVLAGATWILVSSYTSQRAIFAHLKQAAPQAGIFTLYPDGTV